jgi:excisionase family DNA binding protein
VLHELLLSPADVAARLGVHRETVYRLVARGELVAIRVGSLLRFEASAVEAYLCIKSTSCAGPR